MREKLSSIYKDRYLYAIAYDTGINDEWELVSDNFFLSSAEAENDFFKSGRRIENFLAIKVMKFGPILEFPITE